MRHDGVDVNAIRFRYYDNAGRILMIRFVTQVYHHWQLLLLHLCGNLLEHLGAGNLIGQCVY